MDNRFRDSDDFHEASPLLAVLVAVMTLATTPLTQSVSLAGRAPETVQIIEQSDVGSCMLPADLPLSESASGRTTAATSDHLAESLKNEVKDSGALRT